MRKVMQEPYSGCWLFFGSWNGGGYGNLNYNGRTRSAHVASFELHGGTIPPGFDLDHLCRTHCCVNPAHLQPVTRQVNILRGVGMGAKNLAKTHCPNGHPYDGENLRMGKRGRICRACKKLSDSVRRYRLATGGR